MDALEAIKNRRSIRKYKDIPLDYELIGEIIEAGRMSPSAGNLQARKYIMVTKPPIKEKIAEACYHQYWIKTAPVIIVLCGEHEKLARFYGVRGERLYAVQETAVAAQNMIIAAEALGLASCFIAAFDEEELRALLKIPQFSRPQIILTFGYPDEEVPEPPKYKLTDIWHLESYGAKIRDVEGYLGFHWGRNIRRAVLGAGDNIQKGGEKIEGWIDKLINWIKAKVKR